MTARLRPLLVAAVLLAAWPLAAALLPHGAPVGVVLTGVVLGSANGLLAIGLILIYRTNRIVNFAYGSLGSVAGLFGVELYLHSHWNYFLSMGVAVALGLVLGGIVELLVIRRFARSSRLVLTVATIGLAQVLGGMELLLPELFNAHGGPLGGFASPIHVQLTVDPVILKGSHILIVAVVPVVIAALAWFLGRTDAGIAMRAAAENLDRARLLGIPVARLSTLVWIVGGGLSAMTFVLKAPIAGAVPSGLAGPGLLLPALAAAVLARMESLPVAFFAAAGLGALEQLVFWNGNVPSAADVVFLVVILGGLLFRRDRLGRLSDIASSWTDTAVARPIPAELRRLPEVRLAKAGLYAVVAVAAAAAPFVYGPSTTTLLSLTLVWAMVGVSLVVLTGWGGHISLGQFAIVGTGAVTAANLVTKLHADLFVALLVSGVVGAVVALLVGLPALRIRGLFLAVTTLAFAVALDSYFLNPTYFAEYIPDSLVRPELWQRFPLERARAMYFLCLAFLVLFVFLARGVRRSRAGRVLIAARDNRRAAEAASVPTTGVILSGFVFSGMLAGVAGGLHVMVLHGVRVGSYQPVGSLEVFSMAVIGGLGSIGGVLLGVFSLRALQQVSAQYRLLITGTSLLAVLLLLPGGLGQAAFAVRDRFLRLVAQRRGILAPTLVADRRRSDDEDVDVDDDHPADEVDLLAGALTGTGDRR
ncbi:MAG TPA: ABC transporter permease [Acidimicrobiia bacterium]|nr:ABC transporter permease [Acidimicrobiia bacterium]